MSRHPSSRREVLTPLGRQVLTATAQGRVRYRPQPQDVVLRERGRLGGVQLLDVSQQFVQLRAAGWAYIQPYDLDRFPLPVEVPCLVTPAGEDALMEAAQAAKKGKAKR